MIEDRLRPRYSGKSRAKSESGAYSYRPNYDQRQETTRHNQTSPQQRKARAIVNKYRRKVRYAQLYRLKSLVPAVKDKEEATEVDVLQETVKYIEDLERRLLEQVQCAGLPRQLRKFESKDDATAQNSENPASQTPPVQIHDLRSMLHSSLQPILHEKLKKQRLEDQDRIAKLLREAHSSQT